MTPTCAALVAGLEVVARHGDRTACALAGELVAQLVHPANTNELAAAAYDAALVVTAFLRGARA